MVRLTLAEIHKLIKDNPNDSYDKFYERLCKAQLRKVVDEFAKKPDWEALAREMK